MKPQDVYRIEVEIQADYNADEWWESLHGLNTNAERRTEVRNEVARALADRGFDEYYGRTKIKILPNKRKRIYCGES